MSLIRSGDRECLWISIKEAAEKKALTDLVAEAKQRIRCLSLRLGVLVVLETQSVILQKEASHFDNSGDEMAESPPILEEVL